MTRKEALDLLAGIIEDPEVELGVFSCGVAVLDPDQGWSTCATRAGLRYLSQVIAERWPADEGAAPQ
jgi:hypothetical protein